MCEQCKFEARRTAASRRDLLAGLAAGAGLSIAGAALAAPAGAPPKPANILSPDRALARLMAGNGRFVAGHTHARAWAGERKTVATGQNPYAAIVACADSRTAPELVFDAGLGDLFVCRVAGNFADEDALASLEYAVDHLGAPLIVVLGHSACGAVSATIESLKTGKTLPGHLPSLVDHIAPAVRTAQAEPGDLLVNAIRENVIRNVKRLRTSTPILATAVNAGRIRVTGAVYDLASGRVKLTG